MPLSNRRTLLLIAGLGMTLHGVVFSLAGPVLPSIMTTYRLQEAQAGLLLASSPAGLLLGTLGGGVLIDRRGLKSAYVLGLIGVMIGLGLYAVAPAFPMAMAAGLVLGLGSGIVESSLNTLPALIPAAGRSDALGRHANSLMNLVHLYFSLGAFVAPLVIGVLLGREWSWRTIYAACVIPILSLCLFMVGKEFPPAQAMRRGATGSGKELTTWILLHQRPVILGALVLLFYMGAEIGIASWVVLYLQQELRLSIELASAGLSMFWVAVMVGRYANSHLAMRVSARDALIVSGLGGAVCCWGLLTAKNVIPAFGWLTMIGLLLAGVYPLAMASVNSRYPRYAGRVSGLLAACAGGGALLFPPLFGALSQGTSLRAAMGLNGLCMLGVAAAFSFMPREVPVPSSETQSGV